MDLMDGPSENRMVKNVAAMMFCEHPERIFRYTQVDIVIFPEGRISDPNNFSETTIYGSVPQLIQGSLTYLKNNIIREYVKKQKNVPESIRFFNYPIQALEEAIVNALYHRDYQQFEPVEISVEPDGIHILSIPGPDRSISQAVIDKGERMISRRYRNRRLGDFLKELDLTEGRSTGIPTIQEELKKNGSPRATVETNSERSFVNVFIPVHKGCGKRVVLNVPTNASATAPVNASVNVPVNVPANVPVNVPVSTPITLIKTQERIMKLLKGKGSLTFEEMAKELKVTRKTIQRNIAKLKSMGLIERVGEDKNGYWKLNI
jgi:ATP-dependent DNA helicase RecG